MTGGGATASVCKAAGGYAGCYETPVVYRVVYIAESGDKEVREFASQDEENEFVKTLDTNSGAKAAGGDGGI